MSGPIFSVVTQPIEHDSVEQARQAAMEAASASGGRVFPCIVFRQGGRTMLSTSFPMAFAARYVQPDSATKGGNPRTTTNRPLMLDHVKTIHEYLVSNPHDYILPPVTLNVLQLPPLHVLRGNFPMRAGFMVLDDAMRFHVTDGQHRIAAIAGTGTGKSGVPGVLDQDGSNFDGDSIAVLIVVEPDLERIHQDFADAARTKQIPASLLAAYSTREPVNRVLTKVVDGSRLLKGRVDETSKTLPKFSQSIFLLNQVRGLIKELLVRDYAIAEEALARLASRQLDTAEKLNAFVTQTLQLLDTLTDNMMPWDKIVTLPTSGGPANQIPDFRRDYINMTATGLVIIGRVAFEINKAIDAAERLAKYTELATKIDWRRNGEIWQNTIVTKDGKIVTNRGPVNLAANRVKEQLGLL